MKLIWQVALYLEGRRFVNSLRRSLQHPVGLLGTLVALGVLVAGWWFLLQFYLYWRPRDPAEMVWMNASSQEKRLMLLYTLTVIAFIHLLASLVWRGFHPYGFIRAFCESDLHFLFATPLNAWRLMRAIQFVRSTAALGIMLPLGLAFAVLVGAKVLPVLVRDYIEQLRSGAWLLIGYFALRYVQAIFLEFFGVWYALKLRRQPNLRWWVLFFACLWLLLLILAIVLGAIRAHMQGASRIEMLEYALNWLPAQLLSLPARATADALLAVYTGWTPTIGVMLIVWIAGSIWLATYLTRHSTEILDMVALGIQLSGGTKTDEERIPLAVRQQLEQHQRAGRKEFHTPAWLTRWQPRGVWALLWRDMVISLRTTTAWLGGLAWIFFIAIFFAMLAFVKYELEHPPPQTILVTGVYAFAMLFFLLALMQNSADQDFSARFDEVRALPFSAEQFILYQLTSGLMVSVLCLLPPCLSGMIIYTEVWYLWLGGFILITSYMATFALLELIYQFLTAQPYLDPVMTIAGNIWWILRLILLFHGFLLLWLLLMLGIWFPLTALLIALLSLPLQRYLIKISAELWRSYIPMV